MKLTVVLALLFVLSISSCEKNNLDPEVSLIFGEAYGFCAGDCAHFYLINDHHIYKDNMDRFETEQPTFETTPLQDGDFKLAKSLLDDFPPFLLGKPFETFGCPDCADQGGIHIFYSNSTASFFWHIDTNVDNQPVEIREYLAHMRDVVAALKD